jgi:hypothetical protein
LLADTAVDFAVAKAMLDVVVGVLGKVAVLPHVEAKEG